MTQYEFVVNLVKDAGNKLNVAKINAIDVSHKGTDERDLFTNVDLLINRFLISEIKRNYPEHRIYSEEGYSSIKVESSEFEWKLDPIDGSANFSRNIPHFSICVALLRQNIPIIGAIYNPVTNELFSFQKDRGAYLNGKPIQVSSITQPNETQGILIVGHQPPLWDWGVATFRSFLQSLNKIKAFGSSSLDLSFLAAGRADVVVYGTLTTNDCAAGIGIVREAGGEVYTPGGVPVELTNTKQTIIATANKELFENILPLLHIELIPTNRKN